MLLELREHLLCFLLLFRSVCIQGPLASTTCLGSSSRVEGVDDLVKETGKVRHVHEYKLVCSSPDIQILREVEDGLRGGKISFVCAPAGLDSPPFC